MFGKSLFDLPVFITDTTGRIENQDEIKLRGANDLTVFQLVSRG